MDKHSSHANLSDPSGQVTVIEYPPNCTSKHQPADQGIIHAWKKRDKTVLWSIRLDTMAKARELRRQAKEQKMKAGTLGLAQGYQPNILDAIELGRTAWDGVSKEVIARCVLYASLWAFLSHFVRVRNVQHAG